MARLRICTLCGIFSAVSALSTAENSDDLEISSKQHYERVFEIRGQFKVTGSLIYGNCVNVISFSY